MTLEAGFLGDGVELRPDAQGRYLLPPVRLALTGPGAAPVWVEDFACRAEGLPPSARGWETQLADAWRRADPRGRRLDGTFDVRPTPVPHPGFVDARGGTTLRLVVDVAYFSLDPLTGREVRGIPYRSAAHATVSFGAPVSAPPGAADTTARVNYGTASVQGPAYPAAATVNGPVYPTAATAAEAPPDPAGAPFARRSRRVQNEDEVYLGHAAIDYGTSNSTVTLYDGQFKVQQPFPPAQVARLRAQVLKHVLGEPYPEIVREEWESMLALARAAMSGAVAVDGRSVAEVIASETGAAGLFRLCLLLEQRMADCSPVLRRELATRLHHCYDDAFTVPPLEQMRLFPVELGDGTAEVSSRLEVLSTAPLTVRLGEPERSPAVAATLTGGGAQQPLAAFRGLKLRLGSPRAMDELPGHPRPTSDMLIRSALEYLVDRSDRYIARQALGHLGSGRIDDLVLTYPTVATPDVRRRLRALVSEGLGVSRVSMHFDEAVAALMFFVMRDFGGDLDMGVEAFRARSRQVGPGNWTQNILALDIGGGTTDMALLTLSLKDTTPLEVLRRPDADRLGRHYTLTPTVQGSSGHTRLGGDLLTLSVFHWLKSELADRLIAAYPERFRSDLEEAKSAYLDESGQYKQGRLAVNARSMDAEVRAQARRLAEAAVPTCWRSAPTSERDRMRWTFEQLWKLADQAKIHLGGSDSTSAGGPSPYRFGEQELSGLLDGLGRSERTREPIEFELDAAGFENLVVGHLTTVAGLADGMLRERLSEDQPLDRVVLTGKSCAMPLVRDVLVRSIGKDRRLEWDPASIEVEREYAKTATSIGAAWAEQVRQTSFTSRGSVQALIQGRTVVQIDVDNLFFSLPCRFELGMHHGTGDLLLFGANTMLHHLVHTSDEPPVLAVRTETAEDIQEVIRIVRVRQGADNITWGQFKCPEPRHAQPAGPSGVMPARIWPNKIRARYEITADLDVFAYFSQGKPHYTVDQRGPSVDVWQKLARAGLLQSGERPDAVPLSIHVGYTIAGSAQASAGTEIFAAGRSLDETFHDSDAPDAPARAGLLGQCPLPEPYGSGEWEFGVQVREKDTVRTMALGRLRAPEAEAGARALFVATLDGDGALRVHMGGVPFWKARDIEHVEREPGRVLRHLMTVQDKDRDDVDDPFGGLQ
ncbi:hypothetical protein ABT173_31415 [Streptomyces sp. NPDC001795]|uniref:hypothetical protein n=1 Tax=Streptomyces sp. NPDC001795 TaxID=3154525 RepID=UPI0033303A2C